MRSWLFFIARYVGDRRSFKKTVLFVAVSSSLQIDLWHMLHVTDWQICCTILCSLIVFFSCFIIAQLTRTHVLGKWLAHLHRLTCMQSVCTYIVRLVAKRQLSLTLLGPLVAHVTWKSMFMFSFLVRITVLAANDKLATSDLPHRQTFRMTMRSVAGGPFMYRRPKSDVVYEDNWTRTCN